MNEIKYAGFWLRLCSIFIDFILIDIPLLIFWKKSLAISKETVIAAYIIYPIILCGIHLWFLTKYGGSPGKLIMNIRVRKVNGSNITFLNAFRRTSIDILYSLLGVFCFIILIDKFDYTIFKTGSLKEIGKQWPILYPHWYKISARIYDFYFWGEVLILLTNKKKRAIHDFLGGTIVIKLPSRFKKWRMNLYKSTSHVAV